MKKILERLVLGTLIIGTFCFLSYNLGQYNAYSDFANYYNHTENLLDSIYNWDEPFMDTVMETDAYYYYEVGKEPLEKFTK